LTNKFNFNHTMTKLRLGITDCGEKTINYIDWLHHGAKTLGYSLECVILSHDFRTEAEFSTQLISYLQTLQTLDAIVFTGGWDIEPHYYGVIISDTDRERLQVTTSPDRDRMELLLAEEAIDTQLPILGICRGLQLLNVVMGGTLYVDIEHQAKSQNHKAISKAESKFHPLTIQNKDSLLYKLIGSEREEWVSTRHHQAAHIIGDDLCIVSTSDDGIIEAMESTDVNKIILLVQWHPERMWVESQEQSRPELNNAFSENLLLGFFKLIANRTAQDPIAIS
jgi:putative glutamine amidotransferase